MALHLSRPPAALVLPVLLSLVAGCEPASAPPSPAPPVQAEVTPAPAAPPPAVQGAEAQSGPQLRFVEAGPGELSAVIRTFMVEARAEQRTPLIYVGATWCEPCQYFHQAAERGELDEELPRLALLELDLDHDASRLEAAGCRSRMIPLFAVPGPDGRCSDQRIEGSIHGPDSPAQILPRLKSILEGAR